MYNQSQRLNIYVYRDVKLVSYYENENRKKIALHERKKKGKRIDVRKMKNIPKKKIRTDKAESTPRGITAKTC